MMLVFFVLFAFVAEGLCQEEIIERPTRPIIICRENEVYMRCRTICQPQFCNISFTTITCPTVQKCEPGCDCIENYLRDDYGICIPVEKCSPKIQCGENQMPSDCADNYSDVPTIQVCQPGCRCNEGYSRNSYDQCVPTPPYLECGENEEPSTCRQTCPPQTCSYDPNIYACKPGPCQLGCNCKKGYLRDEKGNCIPQEKCPSNLPNCPENEEPTDCVKNIRPNVRCIPCQCIKNFVRDRNGLCVSNLPKCPKNEEPTDCAKNIRPYIKCRPCQCIKNLVRDRNGLCVPIQCTGKYEAVNPCPSACFGDACGELDEETTPCNTLLPVECRPRCMCLRGYQRDAFGNCIPKAECRKFDCIFYPTTGKYNAALVKKYLPFNRGAEVTMLVFFVLLAFVADGLCQDALTIAQPARPCPCPENEEYVKCRTCPPLFCNISSVDYKCTEVQSCESGCDCIKDYLRDYNGVCVLNDKCPSPPPLLECGDNEAPSTCRQTCPPQTCDYDPNIYAHCEPGPCQPGCNCKKGYLRDREGNCIPQEKCPRSLPQCGQNEEPTDCVKNIRPNVRCIPCQCIKNFVRDSNGLCVSTLPQCGQNEEPTDCAKNIRPGDSTLTIKCRPCQCIENFVRDSNGLCVSKEDLCKNEQNTTYTLCPYQCTSTCKNPNGICSQECRVSYGCACRPGYLLSEEGKCILPEDCPGGNPCKENQTFVYCNAGCPSANCPETDSKALFACDQPNPCPSGCACKRNYRRRSEQDDTCILASECPPVNCTRPNEIWNPCPQPCFSEGCGDKQSTICWTLIAPECQPQCVCAKDHRRNAAGICIPISQCPPQCGINEEPINCGDTLYPQPLATDVVSANRIRCLPGCKCIAGYVRNRSGVCVKSPISPVCGKFEEPNICIAIFPSTCPRCRCIKNYVRNSKGECVPNTTLPQCGKNEVPNDCSIVYASSVQPLEPSTDVAAVEAVETQRIRCRPCKCMDGYVRNANDVCVRSEPISPVCGKFEEPNICIAIFPSTCPRCRCIKNYVRNSKGECVPSPKCGQNETYVPCIVPCPSNYCPRDDRLILVQCLVPSPCPGGCACKTNYTRISYEDPRCILASDCPPIKCTEENTEYNSCPSACFSEGCGSLQLEPEICNTLVPNVCRPRCVCQRDYRRDSSGKCIRKEECPPQCGINEEPNNYCAPIFYPQPIEGQTGVIDQAAVISVETERIRCQPCICIKGYIRDINGVCVPKTVCGENEVSTDCKQECPPQSCSWDSTRMDCRPVECKPGCNCIEGYLRDVNGKCIPWEKCPECNGDPNAVYSQCPNQCISSCKQPNAICSQECGEPFGCKCRLGYIQSDEGRCILPAECPGGNPCGRNETYAACLIGCPTNNCPRDDSLAIPQCLPQFPCPGGCACQSNYRRISSEDRRCILASDCPPIKCTEENTEYNSCPSACFSEACGSLQLEPKICNTLVPNVCRPRCVCQRDYRRDSSGKCIRKEKCPLQCGENEEPTNCGDIFLQATTDVVSENRIRCIPGCKCIAGYERDSSGACVQSEYKRDSRCVQTTVECTGANEYMNPCPSACFGDACGELDEETAACNTLVEHVCRARCMCIKGFQRDRSGKCIPKAECPVTS
ncbi:zonadhesin-like [Maniola jurtina]|uniref:zonadhesin-like n=1 Tax=Maniola jurtina TaxID=191418 RepID=UPI001E6864DC|nr:zonadhesin-like [Maniola jurtina]